MPNYRLTFKITGETVPATAGYYGADEQSTTQWLRAGGGMYVWLSDGTYYMGATINVATAFFSASSLSGTWTGINGGTGTPVYSEYTIGEAWVNAEKAVFDSLLAFTGNTEDTDCFMGYLPINEDGIFKKFNIWMLNSGGSAGAFGAERTYGTSGNWCNELINADITGIFENRITAMNFAGSVLAWLKSNDNMNQTGIINWCHLRDLPEAPDELIMGNHRYWKIIIPLEILFLTESVYT